MREGDEFTFTRVDRVCRNCLDLQLLVKDLCDRGITLNATEQPISTKDTHQNASWICWVSSLNQKLTYVENDSQKVFNVQKRKFL